MPCPATRLHQAFEGNAPKVVLANPLNSRWGHQQYYVDRFMLSNRKNL
jgi:hypothetical protein